MVLPTPLELTALGTALLVGAGLVLFFLKAPSFAIDLAIAGAVVLGAASVAYGYEKMGEDKIKPQVVALQKQADEANALAASFHEQAVSAVARVEATVKAKNAAIAKLTSDFNAKLAQQAASVRALRIPADAGVLIQPAIDAANDRPGVATVSGSDTAASAAMARDTTLGEVEQWAGTVIGLYSACTAQVAGLQDYVKSLVDASAKLQPVN